MLQRDYLVKRICFLEHKNNYELVVDNHLLGIIALQHNKTLT